VAAGDCDYDKDNDIGDNEEQQSTNDGAKNEEVVMMASGNDGQCGVRWTQQRQ
jgi:hypothetical protein